MLVEGRLRTNNPEECYLQMRRQHFDEMREDKTS